MTIYIVIVAVIGALILMTSAANGSFSSPYGQDTQVRIQPPGWCSNTEQVRLARRAIEHKEAGFDERWAYQEFEKFLPHVSAATGIETSGHSLNNPADAQWIKGLLDQCP